MDIGAARADLLQITRERFGDKATIRAKASVSDFARAADPERPDLVDLAVRFDLQPDIETVSGRDRGSSPVRLAARLATVSIPRAALGWLPRKGDELQVTSRLSEPAYEIVRIADDAPGVAIFYLSGGSDC